MFLIYLHQQQMNFSLQLVFLFPCRKHKMCHLSDKKYQELLLLAQEQCPTSEVVCNQPAVKRTSVSFSLLFNAQFKSLLQSSNIQKLATIFNSKFRYFISLFIFACVILLNNCAIHPLQFPMHKKEWCIKQNFKLGFEIQYTNFESNFGSLCYPQFTATNF